MNDWFRIAKVKTIKTFNTIKQQSFILRSIPVARELMRKSKEHQLKWFIGRLISGVLNFCKLDIPKSRSILYFNRNVMNILYIPWLCNYSYGDFLTLYIVLYYPLQIVSWVWWFVPKIKAIGLNSNFHTYPYIVTFWSCR